MSKVTKILMVVSLAVSLFLVNPVAALAAPTPTPLPESETETSDINLAPQGSFEGLAKISASSLVSGAIKLILVVAALLFFFMLVVGGIQWIVSGGDKSGSENARKRITSALVGLAIVFAAWAIITLVKTLFGVDIINLTIPSFQPSE